MFAGAEQARRKSDLGRALELSAASVKALDHAQWPSSSQSRGNRLWPIRGTRTLSVADAFSYSERTDLYPADLCLSPADFCAVRVKRQ